MDGLFFGDPSYEPYGVSWFLSIIILLILGFGLIRFGRKSVTKNALLIYQITSCFISASVIFWWFAEWRLDRFDIHTDLPIVFCNFFGLFLPLYSFNRNQTVFDIIYYITFVGAIQAIITPSLKFHFPHYEFIKFWAVHGGLIIVLFYEMLVFGNLPRIKGIWQAFLFIQGYVVITICLNFILGTNYLYLNAKPEVRTLLDLLGEWPYYILFMELLLIPLFFLHYLPVLLIQRIGKGSNSQAV